MAAILKGNTRSVHPFPVPRQMTTDEVGDNLARLVWESFSDFVGDCGLSDGHASEEALILLLWAHTRAVQLAFFGRRREDLVREGLDVLHRAVFEDMVENGTPRSHLPIFEQRVGARYAELSQAAEISDRALADTVVRHLTGRREPDDALSRVVSERIIAVTEPLRDFLSDVELVDG